MQRIVVVGSSDHAEVVLDILSCQASYSVVGLIDSFQIRGSSRLGLQILGQEQDLASLIESGVCVGGIVAIGDNYTRSVVSQRIAGIAPSFQFINAIHPAATLARGVRLGAGVMVAAGVVINPGVEIGNGCLINTRASIDHHVRFGDYASIGPGVTLGGRVSLGELSYVGIGASVRHGISIGDRSVVGGGSMVTSDIPEQVVAYGVPAKVVRDRLAWDKYL